MSWLGHKPSSFSFLCVLCLFFCIRVQLVVIKELKSMRYSVQNVQNSFRNKHIWSLVFARILYNIIDTSFTLFLIWEKRGKISTLRMNSGYSKVRARKLHPFSWSNIIIPEMVSKCAKLFIQYYKVFYADWVKFHQILQFSNIVRVRSTRFYTTEKYNLCYDDVVHLKQHM